MILGGVGGEIVSCAGPDLVRHTSTPFLLFVLAEPRMPQSLPRGDPLRRIQVRHLHDEIPKLCVQVMPTGNRLPLHLRAKFATNANQLVVERVILPNMVEQTLKPFLVPKIRDMSSENVPPRFRPVQLFVAHAQDHVPLHYTDGNYSEREDIGRRVLPGPGPGLGASPHLVSAKAPLEIPAWPEAYCVLQIRDLHTLNSDIAAGNLFIVQKDIVWFDI